MGNTVFIIACVVGTANFLFRWLPLRLAGNAGRRPLRNGLLGRVLDSIGIAAICALLVVSCLPDIMHEPQRAWPALAGFLTLTLLFGRTRSIVMATLSSALVYGVVYKCLLMF
ncbi:L-valine transporter subunit YgaH [Candidatus Sodalis endolongispinus]|uniref:L-valine transporter subunit YgaH n=1 Tax=Candidatus Sodalis endolongispinus TaxID=2812662 RepID=A0ABS5YAN7_9GAMM|nr:L-valine transporter subunit YgaH [Candidatus Sodalis endolongispinus]MBT9431669.1 L-valine transporter subunit YgaH [Candidatus Sodalis endolongispinus]